MAGRASHGDGAERRKPGEFQHSGCQIPPCAFAGRCFHGVGQERKKEPSHPGSILPKNWCSETSRRSFSGEQRYRHAGHQLPRRACSSSGWGGAGFRSPCCSLKKMFYVLISYSLVGEIKIKPRATYPRKNLGNAPLTTGYLLRH